MNATVFVDTDILVHVRDSSEAERQARADEWMVHLWRTRTGRLSIQVLLEYYLIVTQRLHPGLAPEIAREDVRHLMAWRPLTMEAAVLEGAWGLQSRYSLGFWDSTIVSSAQLAGCRYLLTEGLRHGLDFDGVEVINPFEHIPENASMIHEGG